MNHTTSSPPAASQSHVNPSTANAAGGDDVMRILGNVEDQLNRLRAMQKSQDQVLISLAQRSEALQQSERELQDMRRQLDEARQALQREQAEWNQQRTLHETELNRRHLDLEQRSGEVSRKAAEFDGERQRIAAMEAECQKRVQSCEQQQREMATRKTEYERLTQQMQAEHADLLKRVERAESNVGELIQQIETSQRELSLKNEQIAKAGQDAAAMRKRAAAVENALQQATARISQLERDAAELAKVADTERRGVEADLEEASAKLKSTIKAREAAEKELGSLRERLASIESKARSLQSQLEERNAQLKDSQSKLELAGKKLSEFAQVLSEQTPQVERGAAAIAMVEEQQAQIDRLTKQLAEHKLRSDPEEMVRRDLRIEQLTEALRQARGQAAGQVALAELEQRNAALTTEVDQLKVELEKSQTAHEQLRKQLEERVDAQAVGVGQEAALADHAARIAALTAEIEQLHASAAADLKSRLDSQAKAHAAELKKAHGGDETQVKSLRKRIKELEEELQNGRATTSTSDSSGPGDEAQFSQKLREKAERITAVAEHLRRRKTRLAKLRMLLAHRTMQAEHSPQARGRTEEVLQLENERMRLSEVKQALIVAERSMIRKWARHRAAVAAAALCVVAVLCAGAGWLVANHFAPARVSASVALEARNSQRHPMPSDQAAAWRDWHIQTLQDPMFHQAVAKRMAERRIEHLASAGALAQRLNGSLTIDDGQHGAITLTLCGTDDEETTAVLDVLAGTLAMESNRQSDQRGDDSPAVINSERREDGRIRYSALNPIPIRDVRMYVAGPVFAVLLVGVLALILFMYRRLSKAHSVFERDDASLLLD
jgi:chromosome segregation ATPase